MTERVKLVVVATTSRRPLVIALLTVVLAVMLLLLAGQFVPTGASAAVSASPGGVEQLAQDPSAPAGPALDPAPTDGERSVAQNKIIMGLVAAVLLGTVILGNRIRSARRKKIGAQTS